MRLEARVLQLRHHLAHATTNVERARAGLRGLERIGVFRVERGVPVGEMLRIRLVLPVIGILVAHGKDARAGML